MKSVGIDLSSSSIKIVEVQKTSKGLTVSQYFEHALSTSAHEDVDLGAIDFLRGVASQYDPTQTRFVVSLPQDQILVHNKIFPFRDRLKISKSLAFELEEDLPFGPENAVLDAKIVRTIGDQAEVLACAVPKQRLQNLLAKMSDSFIEPSIISSEGLAFANLIEKWDDARPAVELTSRDESAPAPHRYLDIILNIGHSRTFVCVFENQNLIGIRSILWGGRNIISAIAQKYSLPELEAKKELQNKGFILATKEDATLDQISFSDCIAHSVNELAKDLRLTLTDVRGEFNGVIKAIGITGGVSGVRMLGAYLTTQLNLPCNPTSVIPANFQFNFDKTPDFENRFAVALGLAIEGLKKPRNPALNFLRGEFARENHQIKRFWEQWHVAVKVAGASLLTLFVYANLRESFSLDLTERANEAVKAQAKAVAGLKGKNATPQNLKKYINDQKKRAKDLKEINELAKMNSALEILKKISDATPQRANITLDVKRLSIHDNEVQIEGLVATPQQSSLFQSSLAAVAQEGVVKAVNSSLVTPPGKTAFAFNFKVDRGISKAKK